MADLKMKELPKLPVTGRSIASAEIPLRKFIRMYNPRHFKPFRRSSLNLLAAMIMGANKIRLKVQSPLFKYCSKRIKPIVSSQDGHPVTTYLCHRDVGMFLGAISSLRRQTTKKIRLILWDDGTLTKSDKALVIKKINGVEIFSITEMLNEKKGLFSDAPNLLRYFLETPKYGGNFFKKMAIPFLLQSIGIKKYLYTDSDVFFNKPLDLFFEWFGNPNDKRIFFSVEQSENRINSESNPKILFRPMRLSNEKWISIYDSDEHRLLSRGLKQPLKPIPGINLGFYACDASYFNMNAFEAVFSNMYKLKYNYGKSFNMAEQEVSGMVLSQYSDQIHRLDPVKYVCMPKEPVSTEATLCHFAGILKSQGGLYYDMAKEFGSMFAFPLYIHWENWMIKAFEHILKLRKKGICASYSG